MKSKRELATQKKMHESAAYQLETAGFDILASSNEYQLQFMYEGHKVHFFPHSGWHSGSTIIDGRGIERLLKQIKY